MNNTATNRSDLMKLIAAGRTNRKARQYRKQLRVEHREMFRARQEHAEMVRKNEVGRYGF